MAFRNNQHLHFQMKKRGVNQKWEKYIDDNSEGGFRVVFIGVGIEGRKNVGGKYLKLLFSANFMVGA